MQNTDLLVTHCRLEGIEEPQALLIADGHFQAIKAMRDVTPDELDACDIFDAAGQLVLPGLIETHIHLDKACIADRCQIQHGTLDEALTETARAKRGFTEEDVYQRGARVIEAAITMGTTWMRTHVEVDPVVGLTSFHAIRKLQADYAWGLTLEICVFPQDGLHNNPGTLALLIEALDQGADLLGGCPYTDSDPDAHIATLFDLAKRYNVDLDFHLDFDLDPSQMSLPTVIEQTLAHGYQDRVTVGHVTKLSAIAPTQLLNIAERMSAAGVHLTALPSTDLYLMGRGIEHTIPRGVAPLMTLKNAGVICSISSNNIANPYTPYGDASLVRQANLYANVAQLGTQDALGNCLAWVSSESARLLRLKGYGIKAGCRADFGLYPATSSAQVIAAVRQPSCGFKQGRMVFQRDQARLLPPAD
ncbi:amidohydrolase [Saccharospirillum sp. MSK14-1]|uniref:amidohydrolase family protein n=1 Tax=Saccharospirillum sp. MSK14-1 TaxID=1897632 RepID=UPI000D457921|nr:amidohydrolase family protein [Saccharospirillum sp. MSK14-1]PTY36521.1 amidohydrolase [Saccharospirillum sp. MSK14-1]